MAGHSVSRIHLPRGIAVPPLDDHVVEPDALEPETQTSGRCAAFLFKCRSAIACVDSADRPLHG